MAATRRYMFPLAICAVFLTSILIFFAIAEFKRMKPLDPKIEAKLYAAAKNAAQYVPGDRSEINLRRGREALEGFREVLRIDPQNLSAIDGIGLLLFQMGGQPYDPAKFQESRLCFRRHVRLKPEDPEPHYWVGVMDWTLSFHANGELRARYGKQVSGKKQIRNEDPLPVDLREQYLREFGATIDEGIDSLNRAIELRPDYDDAMAYLSLLYRRKADTVNDQKERDGMFKLADDLVEKVKDIKQKRAEQPTQP